MMEPKSPKLHCNSEYRRLYQPMSEQESLALERELVARNDTITIKTWSNIVLYDYEKYEICLKHHIPYAVSQIHARNNEEALLWLCKNQLKRTDLTIEMRRYLIGKRFMHERILGAHNSALRRSSGDIKVRLRKTDPRYSDCATGIKERLGKEYHLSPATIRKYSLFSEAMDMIYEISEELSLEILKGAMKISQENIVAISKMQERKMQKMVDSLLREKPDFSTFAGSRKLKTAVTAERAKESILVKPASIKDMPEYDPDAEAASLALTIPSWISSMKRVCDVSDMSKVSDTARSRLKNELDKLGNAVLDMFDVLKEEK